MQNMQFPSDDVINDVILDLNTSGKATQHPECYILGQKCLSRGVSHLPLMTLLEVEAGEWHSCVVSELIGGMKRMNRRLHKDIKNWLGTYFTPFHIFHLFHIFYIYNSTYHSEILTMMLKPNLK